jgi:hypothetical protein
MTRLLEMLLEYLVVHRILEFKKAQAVNTISLAFNIKLILN